MSYGEITARDCNDTYIAGKYRRFPKILFLPTKSMPQKVNTVADVVVFVRFIHVLLNDISYCKIVGHYIPI